MISMETNTPSFEECQQPVPQAIRADLTTAGLLALSTMTLATVGPDGEPHAAAVYFAADDCHRLYFFSDPESRHIQDIARDGRAAATLFPECFDWPEIRGLQLRGVVRRVEHESESEHAWEAYAAKFPFVTELRPVISTNQLYVFSPNWTRLLDNRRGFGFQQEWDR
jgi:uncharacterized protein YhbP (UPF0306 family)